MIYQYWQHKTSGEVFCISINQGNILGGSGPLQSDEVTKHALESEVYDFDIEAVEFESIGMDYYIRVEEPYPGDVNYINALEEFLESPEFKFEVIKSTQSKAVSSEGQTLEIFPDGSYRVLYSGSIGNLYNSPGRLLSIPEFSEQQDYDISDEDYNDNCFANEEDELKQEMRDKL